MALVQFKSGGVIDEYAADHKNADKQRNHRAGRAMPAAYPNAQTVAHESCRCRSSSKATRAMRRAAETESVAPEMLSICPLRR